MKIHYYIISIITILLSVFSSNIHAQKLTSEQCRDIALKNNRQIKKAEIVSRQTEWDAKAYKSMFYPRIDLLMTDVYSMGKGSFTLEGGNLPIFELNAAAGQYIPKAIVTEEGQTVFTEYAYFPDQDLDFKIKNFFTAGISLTQPIYMGGKITTAYQMAQIGQQLASLNTSLTEDETIVKTEEAYAMAVKTKELITVANSYKTLLDELNKNVESAVRHGMKTKNDQIKVQVKINEAELNILKAENGYRLAKMNLCNIIGLPVTQEIDVETAESDDSTLVDIQEYSNAGITSRYEYELLNKKVELADKEIKLTKSDYLPNVILMGGYTYSNGLELAGKRLLDSASPSVAIGVKIPLVNFGESTNKMNSARAKSQIARLEQDELNEKMQLELQQAVNNVTEARQELILTESALRENEENIHLSRQQYDVGLEPLSDLLEAQALWQKAYADHVEAKCQYRLSQLKALKASGMISRLNH